MNCPRLFRANKRLATTTWGSLTSSSLKNLKALSESHGLSIAAGDLRLLDGKWYVTHSGLLGIAERRHCIGIRMTLEKQFSDPSLGRWIFKATVYKSSRSKGFVGYGDANPSNVSPLVRGAEMRLAETGAVNRALRKAYGIGLCGDSMNAAEHPLAGYSFQSAAIDMAKYACRISPPSSSRKELPAQPVDATPPGESEVLLKQEVLVLVVFLLHRS